MTTEKIHTMVRAQFGVEEFNESAQDIVDNGADTGWNGFTMYADTVPFGEKIRKLLKPELRELADEFGESSMFEMMTHWKCLDGYTVDEIAEGFYVNDSDNHTVVMNALAWYALEETARDYINSLED